MRFSAKNRDCDYFYVRLCIAVSVLPYIMARPPVYCTISTALHHGRAANHKAPSATTIKRRGFVYFNISPPVDKPLLVSTMKNSYPLSRLVVTVKQMATKVMQTAYYLHAHHPINRCFCSLMIKWQIWWHTKLTPWSTQPVDLWLEWIQQANLWVGLATDLLYLHNSGAAKRSTTLHDTVLQCRYSFHEDICLATSNIEIQSWPKVLHRLQFFLQTTIEQA